MKIGIFGGSFDPPHMGHFWICLNAIESKQLDMVFMVPNKISPFKQEKAVEKHHIVNMTRLTCHDCGAIVDTRELDRPGPSYTIDTIKDFREQFSKDELYLIMGGDSAIDFHGWRQAKDISALVEGILVAPRFGYPVMLEDDKMSTIPAPFVQVSSTELRNRLKLRKFIKGLVTDDVLKYINTHKLYQ